MAKNKSPMDREAEGPELKKKESGDGQGELIDTDDPEDKDLIKQARKVRSAGKAESDARDASTVERTKLIDMMKKKGRDRYQFGDIKVELKHLEKVSVKTTEDENGDE